MTILLNPPIFSSLYFVIFQTLEVPSPPPPQVSPTPDGRTSPLLIGRPPSPNMQQPRVVMGTNALISPSRKLGRSMSMKSPGGKNVNVTWEGVEM